MNGAQKKNSYAEKIIHGAQKKYWNADNYVVFI